MKEFSEKNKELLKNSIGCNNCKHLEETGKNPQSHYIAHGAVYAFKCNLEHPILWEFEDLFRADEDSIKCGDYKGVELENENK